MLDLLIHTSDTFYLDPKSKVYDKGLDFASNMKRGYLQRVMPTGHKWGKLELDQKRFVILRVEDHLFNPLWLEPEVDGDKEISDRQYRFPLSKILSVGEYDALKNIPYNDSEVKEPIIKVVDDLKTIVSLNSIADIERAPLKLHGSAGDFDVIEGGGGDYTSLKTAIETEAANISGGSTDANFYISGTWTSADTGNFDIDGWTMGSNNMLIQTSGDSRHNGTYSSSAYRIENTTETFDIETDNVTVDGIQYKNTNQGILTSDGSTNITLKQLICNTQAGNGKAANLNSTGGTYSIESCLFYKTYAAGTSSGGIYAQAGTVTVTNCTTSGYDEGVRQRNAATVLTAKNCVSFNNDTDFAFDSANGTADYCASDDGTGTNAQTLGTWTDEFTDYANGDFSIKDTDSTLYDNGTATGRPAEDIIGNSWTTDDIGAFAYQGGGSSVLPISGILPAMSGTLTRKVSYHRTLTGSL